MKKELTAFIMGVLVLSAAEPGLLLHTSFGKYSTIPDFAKNPKTQTKGIRPELQLRMYNGPRGKRNAVLLNNQEYIEYTHTDNINLKQGTISFWVKPVNWKMGTTGKFQTFFELRSGDTQNRIIINKDIAGDLLLFSIGNGGKKNSVMLAKTGWQTGEWHKIDCTWNTRGMKLYVDGKPPKTGSAQEKIFKEDPDFPESVRWASMRLNFFRGWKVDPEWQTAYDELKIYDRVLSPEEIRNEYEKVFPVKKEVKRPFAVTPALLPVNISTSGKGSIKADVSAVFKNGFLILDYRVANSGSKKTITTRDGELWLNDAVEFHLLGADGKQRQFIVNPAGALYDSLNGNPKWNSQAKVSAGSRKDGWTAHLEIPLSDLGGGTHFSANFCVADKSGGQGSFTWSALEPNKGFADRKYFGNLELQEGGQQAGIEALGDLRAGEVDIRCLLPDGLTATAELTDSSGSKINSLKTTLPAGRSELAVTLKNRAGKTVYSYFCNFIVNPPLVMNTQIYPSAHRIEFRLDFSASGLKKADGQVSLSRDGKVYSSKTFHADNPEFSVTLPIPEKLPENARYTLKSQVDKFTAERKLFIPDMAPLRLKIGVDHSVPKPWVPVKVDGKKVMVLDRIYDFNAGPLPVQATSRGEKLIAAQPRFVLNGTPITWDGVKWGKNYGDFVELTSSGQFNGGTAKINGEVWFDGMYKFDLVLTPGAPLKIDSMQLCWSMPENAVRYALTPEYTPWKGNTLRLKWDTREYNSLLWLTGIVNGLAWWCRSDANWIIDPNRDNIVVERKNGKADICIDLFAKPAVLTKPADYTMVFQATPPKHPDNSLLAVSSGPRWHKPDVTAIGGYSWVSKVTPEHIRGVVSMVPLDWHKFRKSMQDLHSKGFKTEMYGMPVHTSRFEPEYDYFIAECINRPAIIWQARMPVTGDAYLLEPCCGHTAIADFHAFNLDKLYREVPELDGCYFDIMHCHHCENPHHGCSGVDAFGKKYSVSGALNLRAYSLRVVKIHQKYNRTFGVHAHSAYYPFVHDLGDFWMPGEELFSPIAGNPEWGYMEAVSPEAYQSAWNREIRGMDIRSMLQFTRIPRCISVTPEQKKKMESVEYCIHGLAPSMLYNYRLHSFGAEKLDNLLFKLWKIRKQVKIQDSVFHGYWADPVTLGSAPPIRVSWYSWSGNAPYSRMFCVVNTGRKAVRTGLKFDWKKIDIAAPAKMSDLWTGKTFTLEELENCQLKGHNFMLMVPAASE